MEAIIKGLKQYNLTIDDIKNWRYCGGDRGRHLKYFEIACPNSDFPPHQDYCICGHAIVENCYITNGSTILVLGNCCIKKFITKSGRTCEFCDKPHLNRVVNRCNKCRSGRCDKCGKYCNPRYKICYTCKFGKKNKKFKRTRRRFIYKSQI